MIEDVWKFMAGCDQSVGVRDTRQLCLYTGLQCEELAEKLEVILGESDPNVRALHLLGALFKNGFLEDTVKRADQVKLLDADMDQVWVSIGAAISLGANVSRAWETLAQNNLSKINPETGKALKDSNGKVIKPPGYLPPDFSVAFDGDAVRGRVS